MSSFDYDNPAALIGTDPSGLDPEFAVDPPEDCEDTSHRQSSVLGRLGTSGYMKVIPEKINQQQQEEGEA